MREILILDSGVGGLTVLSEIKQRLPNVCCHYLADDDYFPYGTKSDEELIQRLRQLVSSILKLKSLSAIVIACNSASTLALDALRQQFDCEFIGVVPAIKTASQQTKNKRIGLLATKGTVRRGYTEKLIDDFAQGCDVVKVGTSRLVEIAEEKLKGFEVDLIELSNIIQPFVEQNIDVCVLGCTHFPWLKPELKQLAPTIQWIDSGEAISKRVEFILNGKEHQALKTTDFPLTHFYFTKKTTEIKVANLPIAFEKSMHLTIFND